MFPREKPASARIMKIPSPDHWGLQRAGLLTAAAPSQNATLDPALVAHANSGAMFSMPSDFFLRFFFYFYAISSMLSKSALLLITKIPKVSLSTLHSLPASGKLP